MLFAVELLFIFSNIYLVIYIYIYYIHTHTHTLCKPFELFLITVPVVSLLNETTL